MGALVAGDDDLPAEEVGAWAKGKHKLLRDYVQISSATRRKFLGPTKGGSAYIDLFSGPGRCFIPKTGEFIEGGCVAAWRQSVASGEPFSHVIIGDNDPDRLKAAEQRLQRLGAPVIALEGTALENAPKALNLTPSEGLNFAFLDPYKLEVLAFGIFEVLSRLRRIDFLVHISTMDLTRNYDSYSQRDPSPFDPFAPGWREAVELSATQRRGRIDVFDHWRNLVSGLGAETSKEVELIRGDEGQRLYWLLLAAGHSLAQDFWAKLQKARDQPGLDV